MATTLKQRVGIAGQISVTAAYTGICDEEEYTRVFVGSTYGDPGPVVMIDEGGHQVFVTDPSRFGERFGTQWVRRFLDGIAKED